MTSFLFWNVMKRDLRPLIAEAVVERGVEVLLLAESGTSDEEVVAALGAATGASYAAMSYPTDKVRIFSRIPAVQWMRRQTDALNARMAIWSVATGAHPGILLAATHFISKSNAPPDDQLLLAAELAKEIKRVEDVVGHQRTVVVGDLNMNPFEPGMIGASALHAVMTRSLASRRERVVQGTPYRFFYNPMWGFFGDRTGGPPGTFY